MKQYLHPNPAADLLYLPYDLFSPRKHSLKMAAEFEKVKSNLLAPNDAKDSAGRRSSKLVPRRLSSMSANREDLFAGPTVVAPPKHLNMPSTAHGTAHAMELAKHHLAEASPDTTPGATPDESKESTAATTPEEGDVKTTDKFAFAFDIDGVLIKGGDVIPEAIDAMKYLNGENEYNIKVLADPKSYSTLPLTNFFPSQTLHFRNQRWW